MTTPFRQSSMLCNDLLWDKNKNIPLTILGQLDLYTLFMSFPLVCRQFRGGFFCLGFLGKSSSTHEEPTVAISRFLGRNRGNSPPYYTRCLVKEFPNISVRVFTISPDSEFQLSHVFCMVIQVFKVTTSEAIPPQDGLGKYVNNYLSVPFMGFIFDLLSRTQQLKSLMLQGILLTSKIVKTIASSELDELHLHHCPLLFSLDKIDLKSSKTILRLRITLLCEGQLMFVKLPLDVKNLVVFCSDLPTGDVGSVVRTERPVKKSKFLVEAEHCRSLYYV